jgi:alkylation response protein AidB-like acyl-CoA dehydrogenase
VRFSFDPDHRSFASALRELLEKECTADHVREAGASETGRSTERWKRLAEMDLVGLTVPSASGGLGMDEVGLALLLEETGRAVLPEPVVETTAVAVPLLAETGPEELRERWFPEVAEGRAVLTVGLQRLGNVTDAHVADLLLLQAGGEIHAVTPDRVNLQPRPSLDRTRRLFAVDWDPEPATRIAEGDPARRVLQRAFDRGALATSAQLLGIADRLIEMGAEYARERHQFGKPIGSFQAVKHLLADALIRLEFARPVVYRAAFSVARDLPDRARDVSMAKAVASEAAEHASRAALQVHGAVGYTEEHDLHLWLKRGRALAWSWGNAAWHRARVGDAVLG